MRAIIFSRETWRGCCRRWNANWHAEVRRERNRAQEARARLAAIVESSEDAIISKTLEGSITSWNASAERLFGYRAEEAIGQPIDVIVPVGRRGEEEKILERLRRGEHIEHYETVRVARNGRSIDVSVTISPVRGVGGEILGAASIIRDMTERRQAEAELRASELLAHRRLIELNNLYERVPVGLCLLDADLRFVTVNPRLAEMHGRTAEEHLGRTVREILPLLAEELEPALRRVIETNTPVTNLELRGAQGEMPGLEDYWLACYYPAKRAGGGGICGVVVDITDRKGTEEQLRLQTEALRAAANAIVITARDGAIQWVNDAFTRLTGYAAADVMGQNSRFLKSGKHDGEFYRAMWETILAGRIWHGELVNKRQDGSLYTEEMTIKPVSDAGGRITHFIAIKQDITERREAAEALRRVVAELERRKGRQD